MGSDTTVGGSQQAAASAAIQERPALLDEMVQAAKSQPGIYQPGPYWATKTRAAVRQIKRHGLGAFRGEVSGVGTSFADNPIIDVRASLDTSRAWPLKLVMDRVFPFSRVMDAQVALTQGYARDEIALAAGRIAEDPVTIDLLARYAMPDSLMGGCVAAADIDGRRTSIHYLRALQVIDRASQVFPLGEARSMFEIGGGFGANVHLQLELFPKLRKIVYLDVPPNLYVGTCFLRTLYGSAVRDFSETKSLDRISFRDDDSLEILAICPWQIEALDLQVDVFWNGNSFVEMPREVVANYAERVLKLPGADAMSIVLATYGGGRADTIQPHELAQAFGGRSFVAEDFWTVGWPIKARIDPERDQTWRVFLFTSAGSALAAMPNPSA